MEIYIEYALLENFFVDGTLLFLAIVASKQTLVWRKIILSAFLGAVFAVVAIPLSYRLRLSAYYMLDGSGARQSLLQSARSMKGNCLALLRLDLGFWWYYAAQALLTVIGYGDLLLPHLGIQMNTTVAYFLFYVLSLAAQLGLFWWKQNSVSVTYAHAYLSLLPDKENGQLTMDN